MRTASKQEERSVTASPPTNGQSPELRGLKKSPTGIAGFDMITGGGLPTGRPTLVCGGAGSGKTMFGVEFLAQGAMNYGEPGVLMTFEESRSEIEENTRAWHFNLEQLIADNRIAVDQVFLDRQQIYEAGVFDLEGIFIRLAAAIDAVGANRVVLDTLEALFSAFTDTSVLRAELQRLFRWCKERGLTVIVTGERGEKGLTRYGIEEYVADCVVLLDHRVDGQLSTRRLRVIKYRGTAHGADEYPFLITEHGFSVAPLSGVGLEHRASRERISAGVPGIDEMLGGQGLFRGSTVLVSGSAGSGKSSIAASLVRAAIERNERCLYFSFEESTAQILRNMSSIGIDLASGVEQGLLQFHPSRPSALGLEAHLTGFVAAIEAFDPQIVVLDPVSAFLASSVRPDVVSLFVRMVDHLKNRGITGVMTSLVQGGELLETSDTYISSLVDTWLSLRNVEAGAERGRTLFILKSRGMAHSNQVREFVLSGDGIKLIDVYSSPDGVLIGSARTARESAARAEEVAQEQLVTMRERQLSRRAEEIEAQIATLRNAFESEADQLKTEIELERVRAAWTRSEQRRISGVRQGSEVGATAGRPSKRGTS